MVVLRVVSREHCGAPTKLPAPKPYKALDGRHRAKHVQTALGLPNHPCALRAARLATRTHVPKSCLTLAVDYSLDLPAAEIHRQVYQYHIDRA